MKRLIIATFLLAALVLVNISCGRSSAPSSGANPAAGASQQTAQSAPAASANPLDPKSLITDDKVNRYVIYQKEVNTVADLVMGLAGQAYKNSGGSQKEFEQGLAKDERTKKVAEVEASALSKSGLNRTEAMEISKIVSSFTAGATIGDDEMKKTARNEFSTKYGADALAIMEKHLPELSKLQDEMMQAAFGKKK